MSDVGTITISGPLLRAMDALEELDGLTPAARVEAVVVDYLEDLRRRIVPAAAALAALNGGGHGEVPVEPPHLAPVPPATSDPPAGDGLPYRCGECGRGFVNAQGLGSHRRRTHGVRGGGNAEPPAKPEKAVKVRTCAACPREAAPSMGDGSLCLRCYREVGT